MSRPIVLLLMFLLTIPLPLRAQAMPPQTGPDVWRDFAATLAPGTLVMLHLASGQRVRATLVRATDNAIEVLPKTRIPVPVQQVAFDDIRSMAPVEPGLSTAKAVGIGVGAGVAAFLGMLMIVFASVAD